MLCRNRTNERSITCQMDEESGVTLKTSQSGNGTRDIGRSVFGDVSVSRWSRTMTQSRIHESYRKAHSQALASTSNQIDAPQHDLFIVGNSPFVHALTKVLRIFLPHNEARLYDDESRLKYDLLFDSVTNFATVVAVLPDVRDALPRRIFQLHVQLRRPEVIRDQHIVWSGGLVVISLDRQGVSAALGDPTYFHLSGHRVVEVPPTLPTILAAINNVGRLYPQQWQFTLNRLGLVPFWRELQQAELILSNGESIACRKHALRATSEVLDHDMLKSLLPHADVIPAMQSVQRELANLEIALTDDYLRTLLDTIRDKMKPYEIGE